MIKYIVNKNKNTVVAILEGTECDEITEAMKTLKESLDQTLNGRKYEMNDRFTGKAICSDEDEFSVEVGKAIAKRRCLKKYYDQKIKAYHDTLNLSLTFVEKYTDSLEKLYEVREHYIDGE